MFFLSHFLFHYMNEHSIYRAPPILLPDDISMQFMYWPNAAGHGQKRAGGEAGQMRKKTVKGGGGQKLAFLRTSFMDDPQVDGCSRIDLLSVRSVKLGGGFYFSESGGL